MATGTTTLDFGSFPGVSDVSVSVTGQTGIIAGSLIEAWILPADTADHSIDEHIVETIRVVAHTIIPGTGFTITGLNTSEINEPLDRLRSDNTVKAFNPVDESVGGTGTRLYGIFNVAWAWV